VPNARPVDQPGAAPLRPGKWIIAALAVVLVSLFFWLDLGRWLTLESIQTHRETLVAWTNRHAFAAALTFIVAYCALTALSVPGAIVLTLVGGFLFGSVLGTLYVNIGATSGATLAFLAARYLFRDTVERKFGAKLQTLQEGFARDGFNYLLTLRLVPLFPFFLVNLVAGLTRIKTGSYVAATALGIIPASFVFCNAGRQLGTLTSLSDVASPRVLGAFALLGVLALVPIAHRKWRARRSV
jgi:uncharacterized membrane protein YdjX (TVP38/TMEM64 family)